MRASRSSVLVALSLVTALAAPQPRPAVAGTSAGTLPARTAPPGITATDEPGGGRILAGALPAGVTGDAAFAAGLRSLRGYFDGRPHLARAVRSRDGRMTIGVFDAALDGRPVRGLVVANVQRGTGEVACLFDDPRDLARSLRGMEADLPARERAVLPAPAPAAAEPVTAASGWQAQWERAARRMGGVALSAVSAPDGTASIGIAPGFTTSGLQDGALIARAPDGAALRIGGFIGAREPSAPPLDLGTAVVLVAYAPDVASMWLATRRALLAAQMQPDEHLTVDAVLQTSQHGERRSAILRGRAIANGRNVVYTAMVTTSPPERGSWSLQFAALWSPADRIADDVPALVAMARSYRADVATLNAHMAQEGAAMSARQSAQTQASLASNAAARERLQRNEAVMLVQAAEQRHWINQQGASAIHAMNGVDEVYTNGPGSPHAVVPLGAAGNMVSVPVDRLNAW